jgi:hypothetical protein
MFLWEQLLQTIDSLSQSFVRPMMRGCKICRPPIHHIQLPAMAYCYIYVSIRTFDHGRLDRQTPLEPNDLKMYHPFVLRFPAAVPTTLQLHTPPCPACAASGISKKCFSGCSVSSVRTLYCVRRHLYVLHARKQTTMRQAMHALRASVRQQ